MSYTNGMTPIEIQNEIKETRIWISKLSQLDATGVSRVTHGDRTVQYRSGAEVTAAMIRLQRRLGELEAMLTGIRPGRVARRVLFVARKGL